MSSKLQSITELAHNICQNMLSYLVPQKEYTRNKVEAILLQFEGGIVRWLDDSGIWQERYDEGFNAGYDEGFKEGHDQGTEDGSEAGYEAGYNAGFDEEKGESGSYSDGYNTGYEDGQRVDNLLSGSMPNEHHDLQA